MTHDGHKGVLEGPLDTIRELVRIDDECVEAVLKPYNNLDALMLGTVSGAADDWHMIRVELRKLALSLAKSERQNDDHASYIAGLERELESLRAIARSGGIPASIVHEILGDPTVGVGLSLSELEGKRCITTGGSPHGRTKADD